MPNARKFWSIAAGSLLLGVTVLSACGPTATSSTSSAKKGGSVIDALFEEPDTLIPELTNETYAVMTDQAIWAPVWYGDNSGTGKLLPGLATEVPSASNGGISADAKTITIHLRSGLKWSDGSPLTADDVAFSYNVYANPKFANTQGFPTTDPADPIGFVSATASDPTTVVVTFKNPNPAALSQLADGVAGPMPKKVFGSMDPAAIAKSDQAFKPTVTSGPFMVSDHKSGDHLTVVRNPNYYQGPDKPYLDQVTFKIIPDQATILTALQSGQVDSAWFLDVNKLDSYKAIQNYTTHIDTNPAGWESAYFNLQNPILADVNVRKALTMSFDPNTLVTQIWKGAAKPTCDSGAGTFAHFPDLIPCYKQDATAAGQLLDSSGWTMGSDGYRHKGGQTLELRYSTTAGKAYREQTELLAQAAWKQIGVKIDIKNYPANQFFQATASGVLCGGNFDIAEFADTLGYDPDAHTLWSSNETCVDNGGSNYMHYSNPTVDQANKTQQTSPDQNTRKAAFKTIAQQLIADVPVMFYYTSANISCASNKLHNYAPSPNGPTETWNIWDWYKS